ncbi:MAG: exonuclease domain-containing protein [Chloroflexi bacterium]|nr:exonuclease domain-containing protein [Chloroflexota bacterium]
MTAASAADSAPFPLTFVSLDLETTGLNAESDRIIEVGAVKLEQGRIVDSFQQLVNPGHKLPDFVSVLTGITDTDLVGAPPFAEIADELAAFIGDLPMVGQNYQFDLGFLNANGVKPTGPVFDTLDLSRILRPSAASHALGWLIEELGIVNDSPHRALADAEATAQVFLTFWDMILSLDPATLAMIRSLSDRAPGDWRAGPVFELAAQQQEIAGDGPEQVIRRLTQRLGKPSVESETRQRKLPTTQDGTVAIGAVFESNGGLARALGDSYEPRTQQLEMAQAVAQVQETDQILLLEAPPGTGKSLGYLIPAIWRAEAAEEQVVVATSTRGLQEQLATKDVPVALRALGLTTDEVRVAVLKGRGNYLCISRLLSRLGNLEVTPGEAAFFARLMVWLESTESGDLGELPMGEQEAARWSSLSAGSEEGHSNCAYEREGLCFIGRARRAAQAAHLVITNHALLLADSSSGGNVLGEIPHVILDEAHNLEREATDHYGRSISHSEVTELLNSLGADSAEGRPRIVTAAMGSSASSAGTTAQTMEAAGVEVATAARNAATRASQFFSAIGAIAAGSRSDRGGDSQVRLVQRVRETDEWRESAKAWEDLDATLAAVADLVDSRLRSALQTQQGRQGQSTAVDDVVRRIADLRAPLMSVMRDVNPDDDITWLETPRDQRRGISLHWAPMSVAPHLAAGPFADRKSIVLTSATLTTDDSFGFISDRLGIEEPETLQIRLTLRPEDAAAAMVPADVPDPNNNAYGKSVQQAIIDVAVSTGGGVLALFTSHASLRQTYTNVSSELRERGISVLGQGIDGAPDRLAEIARLRKDIVILGAAAFWEGVDLPGDALKALIVTRLPFDVPSDPIIAARGETYENSFGEFQIPRSLLRFKQGVGRLLRSTKDQGVIVILDSRVLNRAYGAAFIDALPTSTVQTPTLDRLRDEVRDWFNADEE